MDALPVSAVRNRATPRIVPLADITVPEHRLRRVQPTPDQEAGMLHSVSRLGVLQPIILRADPADLGRYILVKGGRRMRAAAAAGLAEIPAEFHTDLTDADADAIEAATTIQRQAVAPVDLWRAIAGLQEKGWQLESAAEALGIGQRRARQLALLGRLHPTLLDAVERDGMPADSWLTAVARAAPDVQAAVLAKHHKGGAVQWHVIAGACAEKRIPKARAIFDADASGLAWEEDIFAEPGTDWQFSTRDLAGFLDLQRKALDQRIAESKGKLVAAKAGKYGDIALPKGWTENHDWRFGDKLPRGTVGHVLVTELGEIRSRGAKAPAKPKPAPTKAGNAKPAEPDDAPPEAEDEEDAAPRQAPAPAERRLTHAGQELLAELRTDALRAALRDRTVHQLGAPPIALLLLALASRNVVVSGERGQKYRRTEFDDIAAAVFRVLDAPEPAGQADRLERLATEACARILICGGTKAGNGSGDAAEWIGELVNARATMPRLDRADLLAAMSGDMLRAIAEAEGIKLTKAGALRSALEGAVPGLSLPEAAFGAERPHLEPQPFCNRAAGRQGCPCGWKASDGEDAAECAHGEWKARMHRLGLGRDEAAETAAATKASPPPADYAEQRRQDAAAFETPAEPRPGGFDCGWTGITPCAEEGTHRCMKQCPRHDRYVAWLATDAGKQAKRFQENLEAKKSLQLGRRRGRVA